MKNKVILASASPRRKELLKVIVKEFEIIPSNTDETVPDNVSACETAEYLAVLKAKAIGKKYPQCTVIGADTCVVVENMILGKPNNKAEARQMMELLSGKTHKVITGCAIAENDMATSFSVVTQVEFYDLNPNEIEEYINTEEPYDKAGGYGIQGKASLFVKGIKGDYFNVVGLPVAELYRCLRDSSLRSE